MSSEEKIPMFEASCYLQLEPCFDNWDRLSGFKIAKMTQTRPRTPEGAPLIRCAVRVPRKLFAPYVAIIESTNMDDFATVEMVKEDGVQ